METAIYSRSGQVTDRKVVLDDQVFCPEPNDHAIYLDVKLHLANRRQGTAKAKERSEMSGSTRKLFRQKGTGEHVVAISTAHCSTEVPAFLVLNPGIIPSN